MTDTATRPDPPSPVPNRRVTLPRTAAAARRANAEAAKEAAQRAAEIRQAPGEHTPKLVLSQHVRGESWLDKIADGVNRFCGSMWVFLNEMAKQQIDVLNGQDLVLGTLHDLGTQQLELLHGQETVLSILNNFACKDLPGRQAEILADVRQILTAVGQAPAGG